MSAPTNEASAAEEKKAPKLILFDLDESLRQAWDGCLFVVVVLVCVVVPLRIGFLINEWKYWLPFDIITDIFLWVDILVVTITSVEIDGEVMRDRETIIKTYLHSWFLLDFASALPFEVVALFTTVYSPLYRANRLLRIARLTYYFSLWEKSTSLKPSVIRIFKSTFVILFMAHFIGCLFFLLILLEGDRATMDFTGSVDIHNKDLGSKYIRAFYWSFVTMTGYNNTNPHTKEEHFFSIAVTMIGISLFATIIGTVGSLVTNLDSSALYFRQKMDSINDYMKYKRIPQDLQNDVRNYYAYLWKSGKGLDKNKVLDDLPPYLKNKMSVILNSEIIKKVPLFQQCKDDTEFINEIGKCLKARVCLPNSFVVRKGEVGNEMYFIARGELNVVADNETVVFTLKDGGFFGEIALLYDTKRTASIVARTYCDMFVLTKEDFKKVMKRFPQQSKGIKEIAHERFKNIIEKEKEEKEKQDKEGEEGDASQGPRSRRQSGGDDESNPTDSKPPLPSKRMSAASNPLSPPTKTGSGSQGEEEEEPRQWSPKNTPPPLPPPAPSNG
eukprot:TRINITY_DN1090_c0_g2_i1.p1 TRINITY_DN1090_c0_g2~~TRINITY_DN1090_c0_g2_i1.p1  ORF type:complete len:556 (+),score=197.60 TRINITY_DN1090_c0_g2_i1:119-1786(+)